MSPSLSTAVLRTQSDARLTRMVADGHERAFEAIVLRYTEPLRRYCQRMLSPTLAEDVLQQTFLTAWSRLSGGEEIRDLRPWLYRVAHNTALNTIKRAGYHYEQLDAEMHGTVPTPEVAAALAAEMSATVAAVHALPDRQREVLVRTALDGESRAAVALDLGLSDGAVGQLLHRARTKLRAAASAVTPLPLVTWLAARGGSTGVRVAELGAVGGGAAGAGGLGAGLVGVGAKGAAIVSAGLIAATPIVAHRVLTHHHHAPATHRALAHKASGSRALHAASALPAATPAVTAAKPHVTRSVASAPHERNVAHHRHASVAKPHDRSAHDEGATRREHSGERQKPAEIDGVKAPALGDGGGDAGPGDATQSDGKGDAKPNEQRSAGPQPAPEGDRRLTPAPLTEN